MPDQRATTDQLRDLVKMANAARMYDAADFLQKQINRIRPECGCWTCQEEWVSADPSSARMFQRRMCLCPSCGNKRCPRATHHDNACTGSNDPGQGGSRYAATPTPEATT